MGRISRFKESTMQQVFFILIVLIVATVVAFIKIPTLTVYTYNMKLGWDHHYVPVDVLDEMMTLKHISTLDVLMHTMNDDRAIDITDIEKRDEFYDEDKNKLGDYAVFLARKFTEYDDLEYKMDKYS